MGSHVVAIHDKEGRRKEKKNSETKIFVYFSIKMYFFILYTHFSKHPTSDYLFYTTFH